MILPPPLALAAGGATPWMRQPVSALPGRAGFDVAVGGSGRRSGRRDRSRPEQEGARETSQIRSSADSESFVPSESAPNRK
jgi:hypothetical protein